MNYFNYNAAKAGIPAKTAPVQTGRTGKSEFSANRGLAKSVRK